MRNRSAGGQQNKMKKRGGSRPVSRVLSRTAIHLRRMSPCACSDLPGSRAGDTLALPYLVLLRVGFTLPLLLPATRCALTLSRLPRQATAPFHPCRSGWTWAVCFLWHFPWACAPQALPGTLPCGARTFLCLSRQRLSSQLPLVSISFNHQVCKRLQRAGRSIILGGKSPHLALEFQRQRVKQVFLHPGQPDRRGHRPFDR